MKGREIKISFKALFSLIFLINLYVVSMSVKADKITIVADKWYPYNGTPNSTELGYGIDIVKSIFESAGHTIVYGVMPWHRAIIKTRNGKYNAVIGAFHEEVPDFIFPEEEFGVSEEAFFVKKGSTWKYKNVRSLLSAQVGLIKDYSYANELNVLFKANKNIVQYVGGDKPLVLNIRKLLHGRIDVLVEDPNVLWQRAIKMGVAEKIVKRGNIKEVDNLYIAFSPKNPKSKEYAQIFSNGIRKLKDSGKIDDILAKYKLSYWK